MDAHQVNRFLLPLMRAILSKPVLAHRIDAILVRFPAVRGRLLKTAQRSGMLDAADVAPRPEHRDEGMPFSLFIREYFEARCDPVVLPNLWHVHLSPDFFDLERRTAQLAGLYLDHEFIHALRGGFQVRQKKAFDGQTDRQDLELLVDHVYLALLRRYPSQKARNDGVTELLDGDGIERMVSIIRMSTEYKTLQRRERLP